MNRAFGRIPLRRTACSPFGLSRCASHRFPLRPHCAELDMAIVFCDTQH